MRGFYDISLGMRDGLITQKQNSIMQQIKRDRKWAVAMPNTPEGKKIGLTKVIDLKLAEDGSVRNYVEGQPYPVRFYPERTATDIIATCKRLLFLIFQNKLWGIISLVMNRKAWSAWIEFLMEKYQIALKDEHWSQVVKEVRRVLKGRIDENFLDLVSTILENDSAYRYRLQDIAGEFNREAFEKNAMAEIYRLYDLFISRETDRNITTWRKLRKFIWILRIKGLKQIKEVVRDLKIEELKYSIEDIWHTDQYRIHNCGFYKFRGL